MKQWTLLAIICGSLITCSSGKDPTIEVSSATGPDADSRYTVIISTVSSAGTTLGTQTITFQALAARAPIDIGVLSAADGKITAFPSFTSSVDTLKVDLSSNAGGKTVTMAATIVPSTSGSIGSTSDWKLSGTGSVFTEGIKADITITEMTVDLHPGDGDPHGCDTAYPCGGSLVTNFSADTQVGYKEDGVSVTVPNTFTSFDGTSHPFMGFTLGYPAALRDMSKGQKAQILKGVADANKPAGTSAEKAARNSFNTNAINEFLKSLGWFYWGGSWKVLKFVYTGATAGAVDALVNAGKNTAKHLNDLATEQDVEKQSFDDGKGNTIEIICNRSAGTGSTTTAGTYTRQGTNDCFKGSYSITCTFGVDQTCRMNGAPPISCVITSPVGPEITIACPPCGVNLTLSEDRSAQLKTQRPQSCSLNNEFNVMEDGVAFQ